MNTCNCITHVMWASKILHGTTCLQQDFRCILILSKDNTK